MSLLGIQEREVEIQTDYDQIGHFREFQVGAGSNTVKITDEGMVIGGTSSTDASALIGFDGKYQFSDSNGNVVIEIDPNG